jgi:hypothetical protein
VAVARRGVGNPGLAWHLVMAYRRVLPRLWRERPRPDAILLAHPGQLDTLILRAYVTEAQLTSVRIGGRVQVRVDRGNGELLTLPGTVTWVSSKAEFTPTPVQTRDERADLVYAVKVQVPNPAGALKIGMPADLALAAPESP